ncbi:MAG TPA: hypothetical protein PLU30_01320 [Verrucomicrobiae bacterium]|nr:hypothetical protein [Verrucomicrobiae bacterium]
MHGDEKTFSVDVLALALLTCLLASVVGIMVLAGDGKILKQRKEFAQKISQLSRRVTGEETRLKEILQKTNLAKLEHDKEILNRKIVELRKLIEVRQGIAKATFERDRTKTELDGIQKELDASPGRREIVGNYRGPYVLIECRQGEAMVYPGKTRIESKPGPAAFGALISQIVKAGFVVIVVRPNGWFNDSYDALRPKIYEALAEKEREIGRSINRCVFPLGGKDPIEPYLPPEGGP